MAFGFTFAYHVAEEFPEMKSKAVRCKCAYLRQISFTCFVRNKKERCQVSELIVTQICKESHQRCEAFALVLVANAECRYNDPQISMATQ